MKYLLTVILFITFSANAQEAFVLGKTYRQGWLVWYPSNSPEYYYISKPISLRARKTPDTDTLNWKKVNEDKPAPTVPPVVTTGVSQSSFDSLLAKVRELEAKQVTLFYDMNKRVEVIEQNPPLFTLKVSQLGFPLLRINPDGSATLKSFVPGTKWAVNDSTIVYPK